MYLSQLLLNSRSMLVINDLNDPYQMHRTVMSGFAEELPEDERVLFRLEIRDYFPQLNLLVQSHTSPDWSHLADKGYLHKPASIKAFDPVFSAGQAYSFRLQANPTKRLPGKGDKDGPRVGLLREEEQMAWLERKGEQHGFRLLVARSAHLDQPDGWKQDGAKKHCLQYQAVRFDGQLVVTDANLFTTALYKGIGSGKSMGFGLLSLARPA